MRGIVLNIDPYFVRKWGRAVGVRFKEGVVLAAHRLETFRENSGGQDTLVFAMTGDPVRAEKARQGLIQKVTYILSDEMGGNLFLVSFANTSVSFKPDAYAAGSGSMSSHAALDMLYEKNMSLEEATDLALQAIYDAAFSHTVDGQAVEAVDGDVTFKRHDVKDLHAKYGHLVASFFILRDPKKPHVVPTIILVCVPTIILVCGEAM
ncbi:proteasome subunit beta type-5-like [Papaver somniferum]|uniref:proteasome subunit beta type-5-like n=1 Tax=Papaver somniferum TaxID=3469 RepID=UPI000E6F9AC7|nr:proteasome subunit beta type-5-like [Papaver somniferum]